MLRKYATSQVISAEITGSFDMRKTAKATLGASEWIYDDGLYKLGHRADFSKVPRREGYLYVRNRAISSRANDNWDEWPAKEIASTEPGYGYLTFIGKPVFVEHANENHRRTRGVNIAAVLHEDHYPDGTPDTWVEVLKEIDPHAFPKLAKALLTGRVNRTSMGADVGFSECSKCGNVASTPVEYCMHIPHAKGARFEQLNQKTGRKEPRIVTEVCRKISFFEDTFIVTTPADPTAFILGVDGDNHKTASMAKQADTAPYNGNHTFHFFPSGTKEEYEHTVEAHDPRGQVRGHIKWDDQDGEVIDIRTHPDERGRGLGTELMRRADRESKQRNLPRPGPSAYRTNDGDGFARSFGKPLPERIPVNDNLNATATYRDSGRVGCDYKGCGKTVAQYSDNYDRNWRSSGGNQETWDFCSDEHRHGFEKMHPDWADIDRDEVKRRHRQKSGSVLAASGRTKRVGDGVYEAPSGHRVQHAFAAHPTTGDPIRAGWHLIDPKGEWMNHYMTKDDALNALDSHLGEGVSHQAFKEITLPPRVETLSHTICPTCSSENSFVGDRCSVCNGIKPPDNFMDPDTSIAPDVQDMIEQQEGDGPGVDADGIDMNGEPDLVCPVCGESFHSAEQDEEEGNPYLVHAEDTVSEAEEMGEVPSGEEGPDGQTAESLPMKDKDDMTNEQEQNSKPLPGQAEQQADEDPQVETEEPGNQESITEINPEVEDGQPDADVPDSTDPNAEANEEQAEDAAIDEAGMQDTGYSAGDVCPACGEGELVPATELEGDFPQGDDEAPEGEDDNPFGKVDEDAEEPEETPEEVEQEEAEEESGPPEDEDEETDDEDRPVKKPKSHMGRNISTMTDTAKRTPNPAAAQRKTLIEAINKQASVIEKLSAQVETLLHERVQNRRAITRMASVVSKHEATNQALAVRNETLERQMFFVSKAAGLDEGVAEIGKAGYAKVAAIFKKANPANPAQPIAEPPSEPAIATEQQTMQPGARDDVTQLGASPLTDVSADASVPVDQPYGEYANNPVGQNRVDVTAPVAGTEFQRPPNETIIPVDVRIGNPDNPNPAFGWTMGPVGGQSVPTPPGPSVGNPPVKVSSSKRTYATLRLAKLQIEARIASGDELEIAAALDSSDLPDAAIEAQIETLAKVLEANAKTAGQVPSVAPQQRRLVPKAASADVHYPSINPSMGNPNAPHSVSAGPIVDDEMAFI